MPQIEKSVLVRFSAAQMYALVEKVEDYPQFLQWCGGASVSERTTHSMEATIAIRYRGISQSFTTRNKMVPGTSITMGLKDGPFSNLDGVWRFTALREDACKVEFSLHYTFSNIVLEKLIGPVFSFIASTLVDGFTKRAESLYGGKLA